MQLVIKSNIKTSVTTYIHATTYIHVKPIFTQALMIWLQFSGFLNNFVRVFPINLKIGMLYHMNSTLRNTVF